MNIQSTPLAPAALLREVDARMTQALDNFFQRSHAPLRDTVLRAISAQMTPAATATGQTCLDWLNTRPDALSTAFADQFRRHLARPETFTQRHDSRPAELQLLDDNALKRQLAEEKIAAQLIEDLRADMLLLFGRLQAVRRIAQEDQHADAYGPRPIIRALSRALDALDIESQCGTLLLQCAAAPLLDTLKHTYAALDQFLCAHNIPELLVAHAAAPRRRTQADTGQTILAHIQSVAAHAGETGPAGTRAPADGLAPTPRRLIDSLAGWQTRPPGVPVTATRILQPLQQDARRAATDALDLAVLEAVTGLFECILGDPDMSPRYKAALAQLQIPTLRAALAAPDFFSDDQHPARQLIDLAGLFSRRFPERTPLHVPALEQIETHCAAIRDDPGHPAGAFAQAHNSLAAWLAAKNAHVKARLAAEVTHLEHVERQELGTLLALENLHDLTERYPAPESVLRQLEAAWVPHMASLYVAESGEGPGWRAACHTLLQLFLSLQAPQNGATREARLQSIPSINAALRGGLLAQGAEPGQLKNFFSAITATQECWIRPALGQREAVLSTFTPRRVAQQQIESLARQFADTPADDPVLQRTQQLREGDWVNFEPPCEGLAAARVAWVGVHGHLLFCGGEGEQWFSLDHKWLAAEIRAGRASIPEQSLTGKAMLCLKRNFLSAPG